MAHILNDARWYLADVVLEHTIEGDPRNVVHVNLHLVEADSPERAYEKALALGKSAEQVYTNTDGREVRVVFRGLQDLHVIHDDLEDGAELAYAEHVDVPEAELRARLRPKEELGVFRADRAKRGVPNYMPDDIMRLLEAEGVTREEIDGEATESGPVQDEVSVDGSRAAGGEWRCPGCHEVVPAQFDVCWNCGVDRAGSPDPAFQSAVAFTPQCASCGYLLYGLPSHICPECGTAFDPTVKDTPRAVGDGA